MVKKVLAIPPPQKGRRGERPRIRATKEWLGGAILNGKSTFYLHPTAIMSPVLARSIMI